MTSVLYLLVIAWIGWLLISGVLSGEIWVKGGVKDRFTRQLDMYSFAHKVNRETNPTTFWIYVGLYSGCLVLLIWYWQSL